MAHLPPFQSITEGTPSPMRLTGDSPSLGTPGPPVAMLAYGGKKASFRKAAGGSRSGG